MKAKKQRIAVEGIEHLDYNPVTVEPMIVWAGDDLDLAEAVAQRLREQNWHRVSIIEI